MLERKTTLNKKLFPLTKLIKKRKRKSFLWILLNECSKNIFDPSFGNTMLNKTALHEPKMLYDILFESAWETLQTFGKNKNLQMGMIAVLHTWGQNLSLHPHLHCIVPGGGVDENGAWKNIKNDGKFLFSVRAWVKFSGLNFVRNWKLL